VQGLPARVDNQLVLMANQLTAEGKTLQIQQPKGPQTMPRPAAS
jgi:hypothetical protein